MPRNWLVCATSDPIPAATDQGCRRQLITGEGLNFSQWALQDREHLVGMLTPSRRQFGDVIECRNVAWLLRKVWCPDH